MVQGRGGGGAMYALGMLWRFNILPLSSDYDSVSFTQHSAVIGHAHSITLNLRCSS